MQKTILLSSLLCSIASGFQAKPFRANRISTLRRVVQSSDLSDTLEGAKLAVQDGEVELELLREREKALFEELAALKELQLKNAGIPTKEVLLKREDELANAEKELQDTQASLTNVKERLTEAVDENSSNNMNFMHELKPIRAENDELQASIKEVSDGKKALLAKQAGVPGSLVLFTVATSMGTFSVVRTAICAPFNGWRFIFRSLFGRKKTE